MKSSVVLSLLFISLSANAFDLWEAVLGKSDKSSSCKSGAGSNHTNPDNTLGGFVAKTAKVEPGATVAVNAQVCEFAQVKAGAKILGNAIVGGRAQVQSGVEISGSVIIEGSPLISGSTKISSLAKVTGNSKIHNAIICQASQIENFDVIDSDYYCQTEDPEPPHPGELGKRTLLGVDTDLDGVRDDVEILINARYSNTPQKDNRQLRLFQKEIMKQNQLMVKFKNNKPKVQQIYLSFLEYVDCTEKILGREQVDKEISKLEFAFYDTPDRQGADDLMKPYVMEAISKFDVNKNRCSRNE